jgi:hypothetical protein
LKYCGPVPRPKTKRPLASASRFAALCAATTGLRAQVATPVASRIRSVRAAIAASGTSGSTWTSACQTLSNPAASSATT